MYTFIQENTKLIRNASHINTNNEIQLLKKYNFILITNVISLQRSTTQKQKSLSVDLEFHFKI